MATDVDFTQTGTIEFTISGSSDGGCSGLFGAGDVLVDLEFVATCGSWEFAVSPELVLGGDPEVDECEACITYHGSMLDFTLDHTGVDFEAMYDIEGCDGNFNIPSNPGVKIVFPLEMATLTLVANNQCGMEAYCATDYYCYCDDCYYYDDCYCDGYCYTDWCETDGVIFNFGAGLDFSFDMMDLGIQYASNADKSDVWYGNALGVQASFDLDPLSLVVQYGTYNPGDWTYCSGDPCCYGCELYTDTTDDELKSGAGYYAELGYDTGDMGSFTISYTYADEALNGMGYETPDPYSSINFEYTYPMAECVDLILSVTNTDCGMGGDSVTDYEGKVSCSF
jgi:hypothetical protein